ncbi:hypothetical protein GCM10009867_08590 [Pedococcus aerophilus]|uniref:Uncharacterized protein n=1 Tax=Pedococcus aerophilus TaxID=436356 RepID=A0ABN3UH10_9MICO
MDRKSLSKALAGKQNRALEISHALRSEGREGATRTGSRTRAQVSRITVDRLDRARPGEVLRPPGHGSAGDAAEELRDR